MQGVMNKLPTATLLLTVTGWVLFTTPALLMPLSLLLGLQLS
jgi:hypothetical protein